MKQVWPLLKKPGKYNDPGFPNFSIAVSPKGKCVWRCRYSESVGGVRREASETFGQVQPEGVLADGVRIFDLDQAHEAAREWLAEQKDPTYAAQKAAERAAAKAKPLTLEEGFEEFLRMRRTKSKEPLASRTVESYRKTFNKHLVAAADWPLLSTSVQAWTGLLKSIDDKSPSRAMEAMAIVSGIYNYYEGQELPGLTRNPIRKVRMQRLFKSPPKRTGHATAIELQRLMTNIYSLRDPASRDLLLAYTLGGFRKSAGMRLRRSIVDFGAGVINVPEREPGWKGWYGAYPLNSQIFGILKARADALPADQDWLFPARHGTQKHRVDVRGGLKNASEGLDVVLISHDLRRTFAKVCDIVYPGNLALAGALLTHKWAIPERPQVGITLGYQPQAIEELRHASETVCNALLEIAGMLPMSDATAAALRQKGIDPAKLELDEIPEDDDE